MRVGGIHTRVWFAAGVTGVLRLLDPSIRPARSGRPSSSDRVSAGVSTGGAPLVTTCFGPRGRRGVPPDAPLDFAPPALQPLIRRDGVTDRRRWESALFLKVRDEIQTGNLAIDGAKNFGRFEAFFLPAVQWAQVRDAFWTRTGFPVDPGAAVERLKERLSDAFDRFLELLALVVRVVEHFDRDRFR